MPRPQRCRRICGEPCCRTFSPDNADGSEDVVLTLDEYEAVRLIDYHKLTHAQCAEQMDVSRTTITEIYEEARYKISCCIVGGRRLRIEGGNYRVCEMSAGCVGTGLCRGTALPSDKSNISKEVTDMKVAAAYENGMIFQHFGHTEMFKLYTIENGAIASAELIGTNGSGHGALAALLAQHGVDALICGGIGGGAQTALAQAGIKLYGGVSGDADKAVSALIAGSLEYNPDVKCSHHEHEHGEGHTCGSNGCGSQSCH